MKKIENFIEALRRKHTEQSVPNFRLIAVIRLRKNNIATALFVRKSCKNFRCFRRFMLCEAPFINYSI